jgi:hypothetical protein
MIPELRSEFNRRWRPDLYDKFLQGLEQASSTKIEFRCCETPVFLPRPLLDKMVRYGKELYDQLAGNPDYLKAAETTIPREFYAPGSSDYPLFLQVDFGLVRRADDEIEPKLVEIQGFPSLYGFQAAMAREYERAYSLDSLDASLTSYLGKLNRASYESLLGRAILNGHDPKEVVLLEIEPYQQKTLCDFLVTERLFGLMIADLRELKVRGHKLYLNGSEIKRIYNRVIVDELVRKEISSEFRFTDEVDVEWAGHPNWFFRISKYSLPWLKHESVPETWFLSELNTLPDELNEYVLKPLYSFAGLGVKIGPSLEEIAAIPADRHCEYILQRKMDFVPTIETPSGPTKAEIRLMYIWDGEMVPVMALLRTGRGKMMGVDFNKDLDWVGASAGFFYSAR